MFFDSFVKKTSSVVSVGALVATGILAGQDLPQPGPMQTAPAQQMPAQSDGNGPWTPVGQGQQQQGGPNQAGQPGYNQPGYNQPGSYQPGYGPQPGPNQPVNNGPSYPPAYNNQAPYNQAPYNNQGSYNPGSLNQGIYNQGVPQAPAAVPAQLTVPGGTFITVRVNQLISSDHNQAGDAFTGSLVEPLVVNGVVVAEPGQTIAGEVVEAQKAGRVEGVARLKVQLTGLTLVDGQQLPIHSSLVNRKGNTSVGRDAGAIAGTTGLGAAIGAAAGWGTGAAIGAGAGAVVGTVGVLLTRGRPSIISPEQVLTFRIDAPLTIDTTRSVQAFRYVQPNEYDRPNFSQPAPGPYAAYPAPVAVAAAPYGYGYPYYNPYGYAPGFSLFVGSGFYRPYYYGRGFYGGRGYYGGGFRRR